MMTAEDAVKEDAPLDWAENFEFEAFEFEGDGKKKLLSPGTFKGTAEIIDPGEGTSSGIIPAGNEGIAFVMSVGCATGKRVKTRLLKRLASKLGNGLREGEKDGEAEGCAVVYWPV